MFNAEIQRCHLSSKVVHDGIGRRRSRFHFCGLGSGLGLNGTETKTRKLYKTISPRYTIHSTYSIVESISFVTRVERDSTCLNLSHQDVAEDDESEGRDNDEDEEFESKDDASDRNDDDSDNFSRLL